MRLTRKVFHDVAIWMTAFGVLIGLVFPFFMIVLGVPSETALTPAFFAACMSAGTVAGGINYAIARQVIGSRMSRLADVGQRMRSLAETLRSSTFVDDNPEDSLCGEGGCVVEVDSDDEIGAAATSFNELARVLGLSVRNETAVRTFNTMLTGHLEIDDLTLHAIRSLVRFTGSSGGAFLVDVEGDLQLTASIAIEDPDRLTSSNLVHEAIRVGRLQRLALPENLHLDGLISSFRPAEVLVSPVTYKSVNLGAVVLGSTEPYGDEVLRRLELFGQGLSLALNNALIHGRIKRLATLDPLTGVLNRRFGMGRLREEFRRAVRGDVPLGLLMFDIDHFKRVNDTYGHQTGDRIIQGICQVTKARLREGDVLVRYGGEEFLVILPAASTEDLLEIGERLRRSVEDLAITSGESRVSVTISLGGSAYPDHLVEGEEDLIRLADEALYIAKDKGRNQVATSTRWSHAAAS